MKRLRVLSVLAAIGLAACAAMRQQQQQPVRSDQGEFKNLRVLPPNITHDELIATMRGFARALGTRCDGCHVPIPGEQNKFDFASDAKDEKRNARTMILMTRNINANYLPKLEHGDHDAADQEQQHPSVTCWTCHRGHMTPESPAAPSPQQPQHPGA